MRTPQQHNEKAGNDGKCFGCYAESGLSGTGIKALADGCGCTTGKPYTYFDSVDDLTVESTAYCMARVEDAFLAKVPADTVESFDEENTMRLMSEKATCNGRSTVSPKPSSGGKA